MTILPTQIARVSNQLQMGVATSNITAVEQQLLTVQNELSTGKKVSVGSDDPGAASAILQLQQTLSSRTTDLSNISDASNQYGEIDTQLGNLEALLRTATSTASANVSNTVSANSRAAAAQIVQSLYSQAVSIANTSFQGQYIFAGDDAASQPFTTNAAGQTEYVGSTTTLSNEYDDATVRAYQVNGQSVFNALSAPVGGNDLSPNVMAGTRLSDTDGAQGKGINKGSFKITGSSGNATIDISSADTVGDVVNAINAASATTGVTATVNGDALKLTASSGTFTVTDTGGISAGSTAASLGILQTTAAATDTGTSLQPRVTTLTPLAALNGGAGLDAAGFKITNGSASANITTAGLATVGDLLNEINGSNTGVRASISSDGNGIVIQNATAGTNLQISENGGATAAQLGVRTYSPDTTLASLNGGKGVNTVTGDDIEITHGNGTKTDVDLDGAKTVQDVIDKINAANGSPIASFSTTGNNGIVLTDTAPGSGQMSVSNLNSGTAGTDLGLVGQPPVGGTPTTGGTITGKDVGGIASTGLISDLASLRDAMANNDTAGITTAAENLQDDLTRVTNVRGAAGAQLQELQTRQTSIETENTSTQTLISNLQDVDMTTAITQYNQLQTALQATLEATARVGNMSLLDFLS